MMMNPQGMRFQGQPGMPRAQAPFQRAPMGARNMFVQPQHIGVRPMMAPAGVRQQFGVNSPYKFNQQVRNAPQQFGQDFQPQVNQLANQFQAASISNAPVNIPAPQQQQQQPAVELNAAMLAAAEPSQQKQMLGERIYPLVNDQIGNEQAGKVTGMLLEIENFELLKLIDEPTLLKEKVTEAMKVLQEHAGDK